MSDQFTSSSSKQRKEILRLSFSDRNEMKLNRQKDVSSKLRDARSVMYFCIRTSMPSDNVENGTLCKIPSHSTELGVHCPAVHVPWSHVQVLVLRV